MAATYPALRVQREHVRAQTDWHRLAARGLCRSSPHDHYRAFFEYGDAAGYRMNFDGFRGDRSGRVQIRGDESGSSAGD